ncbi:hypothetical protein Scep_030528 [Stephania cephalantha]|uniref:Uncharacterized protein n=1 Tax=Stephania cephalantha TaxID=152367 RepID=A0AAP0HGK2_9MAGN
MNGEITLAKTHINLSFEPLISPGLADDDVGGVVEEDVAAEAGSGVDVDREDVGDAGAEGEGAVAAGPKEVGDAVGLAGEEALVVEEAVAEGGVGGVAVAGCAEVGCSDGGEEVGVACEGVEEEVVEEGGG